MAVLLVFVGATAGILLPLRLALAVSSLAAIALITQPAISTALGGDSGDLLGAGTYALTVMVITALTHVLACWARDFRLIAERQMQTVTSLEQIDPPAEPGPVPGSRPARHPASVDSPVPAP